MEAAISGETVADFSARSNACKKWPDATFNKMSGRLAATPARTGLIPPACLDLAGKAQLL